jgi:hypothetical protein
MVNSGRSAFPSEGVRTHVRVGCDQSLVGTWAVKTAGAVSSRTARLGRFRQYTTYLLSIFIVSRQTKASRPEIAEMQVRRSSGIQHGLGSLSLPLAGRGGAWAIGRAGPPQSAPSKKPRVVLQ